MVFVGSSPKLLLWLLVLRNLFGSGFAAETTGTNIYAVIVSSSRYWFNYRHAMNALGIYQLLKGNGVPDSQIVLMIADEYATNARNPFKNEMYANGRAAGTWYSNETEIDYRGADVTVQNFMNAVLGTSPKSLEMTNSESKLLIYLTGHGGDQFFKFQDEEELTARDIANLADELYRRKKFDQALWIADTCQAFTLFDNLKTPNTIALGTSLRGENAYAHHSDTELGLSVIERWTHGFLSEYSKRTTNAKSNLHDVMLAPFEGKGPLGARVGSLEDSSSRKFKDILLTEFFGTKTTHETKSSKPVGNSRKVIAMDTTGIPNVLPPKKLEVDEKVSLEDAGNGNVGAGGEAGENQRGESVLEPTDATFAFLVGALLTAVLISSVVHTS